MYTSHYYCPACNEETEYVVLQEARELLVRCRVCGTVRRIPRQEETPRTVKTIVSLHDASKVCSTEVMEGDYYAVGDMLVAECGEEALGVEITAIEQKGRRVRKASGDSIDTLWTRAVDQVVVKASIHAGWKTIPMYQAFPGEEEFAVGESYRFGNRPFRVSHIKLRRGDVLRRKGQKAVARDVRRLYGYGS
ncbi:MAG: HVO_0476 family zinc finger protein [Methanomicrobiales archaeon]|nr:HVO_0476 family zinc finger protein [Methanomicrobiales archaeon]MDI6875288.1 HVO_0476 family zinc finger protein [Methanomicrobiales archaeon]